MSDGNVQKPTPICNYLDWPALTHEYRSEVIQLHTTGIYRCSTLDMNMKFCENF